MDAEYGTRTGAQRLWLAGAASLLALLIVGGGWLAWRGLGAATPSLAGAVDDPPSPADPGEVAFGAPRLVEGVPWGFALTPQGAAAAGLVAVAVTGQDDAVFDRRRFDQVAAVVFTPGEAAVQAEQVAAARTEFELSGWAAQPASRRMYHFAPLAVRLVAYDPDGARGPTATVEVWAMTLVGVGDAGGAVFTTSTVELGVADSGRTWTVTGLGSVEGPTPMVAGTPSAPGRTRAFVRDAVATLPLPLTTGPRP